MVGNFLEDTLLLWLMLAGICSAHNRAFYPSRDLDVLSETQEATLSVLRNSWVPSSSIVFLTDGSTPSSTIYNILDTFGMELSISFFEAILRSQSNVTHIQHSVLFHHIKQIGQSSRFITLVVASDDEAILRTFLEQSYSNDLLEWPTRLLVVTRLSHTYLHNFQEILSLVNGMVIILEETSKSKRCGVFMYLPYSYRSVHLASWTLEYGLIQLTNDKLFPDKFHRLTDGATFTVVGENFPPLVEVTEVPNGIGEATTLSFSGPSLTFLDMLAKDINFTYSLVRPPDRSWGYQLSNGTWMGMIGMVTRKEVDLALGPFGMTYGRSKVVDYTKPLVIGYGRILGRRGTTKVDPWSFVMPFSSSVWISIFVVFFIILGIVSLISKIDWNSPSSSKITLFSYCRVFLQQDIRQTSGSWWERLIVGSWMLGISILLESYSGNLMSLLAVRYVSQPYQSVRDVLDDIRTTMLWVDNTAYVHYYKTAKSGIFQEVAKAGEEGRIKYISTPEYEMAMDTLVSQGDYVLLTPYLSLKMLVAHAFTKQGSCNFYLSKERFMPLTFCLVVQKSSPIREAINKGIRAVTEGGIYNYWINSAIPNSTSCNNPPTKITIKESLSITNIWGMFVVIITGYMISLFVLGIELICAKIF